MYGFDLGSTINNCFPAPQAQPAGGGLFDELSSWMSSGGMFGGGGGELGSVSCPGMGGGYGGGLEPVTEYSKSPGPGGGASGSATGLVASGSVGISIPGNAGRNAGTGGPFTGGPFSFFEGLF